MKLSYLWIAIILTFTPACANKGTQLSPIVAVVNHDVITATDIESRLRFFELTSNSESKMDKTSLLRMVMQSLIFESIQRQAAESKGLKVPEKMLKEAVEKAAKNNNMTLSQMEKYFSDKGIKMQTFKDIIYAQMAWVEYVRAMHSHSVQVSEKEIDQTLEEIKSKSGESQYDCVEVFLTADASREAAVRQDAEKIAQQLRTAERPQDIARQFSQAPSAQKGGEVFLTSGRLEPALKSALKNLKDGEVSSPIRVAGGFKVIKLLARRFAGEADPLETEVSLVQVGFEIPSDISEEEVGKLKSQVKEFEGIKTCKVFQQKAVEFGGKAAQMSTKLRQLPPPVITMIRKAGVGNALPAIQPDNNHVIVMMPCAFKKAEFKLPSRDEIMQMLQEEKISRQAQRDRMRLYAAAFIDVKDPKMQSAQFIK